MLTKTNTWIRLRLCNKDPVLETYPIASYAVHFIVDAFELVEMKGHMYIVKDLSGHAQFFFRYLWVGPVCNLHTYIFSRFFFVTLLFLEGGYVWSESVCLIL